jgi:hypothetical protein
MLKNNNNGKHKHREEEEKFRHAAIKSDHDPEQPIWYCSNYYTQIYYNSI